MSKSNRNTSSTKSQQVLFGKSNPLESELGTSFFDGLPTCPGVYKLYSKTDHLLYIGKAKNLRRRLFQYKQNGKQLSRKVRRMINMTGRIEIETFQTELEALLRENKLLRELNPEYNVAKTQPESYYFIGLTHTKDSLHFDLTMQRLSDRFDWVFGAFKGHQTVRSGLGALLRQLWLYQNPGDSVFSFPSALTRRLTADHFELSLREGKASDLHELVDKVRIFFEGSGSDLIELLGENARERGYLDRFLGKLVLEDLERIKSFYNRCARRNYKMYRSLDLESPCIPQHRLDDCLVRYAFTEKNEEKEDEDIAEDNTQAAGEDEEKDSRQ